MCCMIMHPGTVPTVGICPPRTRAKRLLPWCCLERLWRDSGGWLVPALCTRQAHTVRVLLPPRAGPALPGFAARHVEVLAGVVPCITDQATTLLQDVFRGALPVHIRVVLRPMRGFLVRVPGEAGAASVVCSATAVRTSHCRLRHSAVCRRRDCRLSTCVCAWPFLVLVSACIS